jgi:hypothetical protein
MHFFQNPGAYPGFFIVMPLFGTTLHKHGVLKKLLTAPFVHHHFVGRWLI